MNGGNMIDAIDELVARSKPHKELRAFHEFHRAHPEVLAFLIQEIDLRLERGRFKAFSYHSLWEYCRWKLEMDRGPGETFLMNDHAVPFYARAIAILRPDLNGRAEMRTSKADEILGVELEPAPESRTKGYARRLRWAGGTSLERGWRPTLHVIDTEAHRRPDIHERTSA
jgi:hypothetical protein